MARSERKYTQTKDWKCRRIFRLLGRLAEHPDIFLKFRNSLIDPLPFGEPLLNLLLGRLDCLLVWIDPNKGHVV